MNPPAKRVLLAAPCGFCAGVVRAIQTIKASLERYGPPIYVRHEIVHNQHVIKTLEKKGAVFVDETDQAPESAIVIFSAHGVAPAVHEQAARRNLATIDATCPLVTRVHKESIRYANEGYDFLLIGHEGHEEVTRTLGHAPHRVHLVDGPKTSPKSRSVTRTRWCGCRRPRCRWTRRRRRSTRSRRSSHS